MNSVPAQTPLRLSRRCHKPRSASRCPTDWVVICLIVVNPFWAPTKVFALPIAVRLYRNRQGLTKGKKGRGKASKPNPDHRTPPQLARMSLLFFQKKVTLTPEGARWACRQSVPDRVAKHVLAIGPCDLLFVWDRE
jgi:hypothetical protein